MQMWEYTSMAYSIIEHVDVTEMTRMFGDQGWELVLTTGEQLIFKRPYEKIA